MSDHSFARVRLFLLALLNSLERLQELLGKQWPDLRSRLLGLLGELLDEFQENRLPARVNRICRAFDGTEAEPFVRGLFREANGKTLPSTTAGFLYHDGDRSTVADSRSRGIDALHSLGTDAEATPLAATAEDLREVARGFARVIAGSAAGVEANATDHESVPPAVHATDTTVTAHPQLRGDDQAYVDEPYRFQVKLSDQPQPGGPYLAVPEMAIPVAPGETVKKLQVKLSAPDFNLDPADAARGWLREIHFYPEAGASGTVTFTLRARNRLEKRYFASLRVEFGLHGQVLGHAARRIEVLENQAVTRTPLSAFPPAPGYPLDERGKVRVPPMPTPIRLFPASPGVHLTITISEDTPRERLLWQIASPYLDANEFPAGDCFSRNLGTEEFVKHYLAPFGMPGDWPEDHMDREGHLKPSSIPILYNHLLELRHSAPPEFWAA